MGDRNLLNAETGGRQVSGTCFLQRWNLPWVGAKSFWHIVCRVSQIPEHHSWLSLPLVEARYPVELMQCCQFSHTSKTLDPKSLLYFELRKNCDLALKVVGFSWSIQLNSCERVKAGQWERGRWSTAAAPQGNFWLLNKAVNHQIAESSQLLFLPSRSQHWKLHLFHLNW